MGKLNPKIIALACSPSRGRNSDSMLNAFLEGVASHPTIAFEKIYLSDIQIDTFTFENGTGPQAHETVFKDLTGKIKCAQGLIIAAPTYNFAVPAHLKNFIDRLRFFALDMGTKNAIGQPAGMLGHLKTFFLVSGGTPKWAETLLFFAFPAFWLRSVFLYYGSDCLGAYYSGDVASFKNEKILNKCRRLGKRYGKKLIKNSRHSLTERLFWRPPQRD